VVCECVTGGAATFSHFTFDIFHIFHFPFSISHFPFGDRQDAKDGRTSQNDRIKRGVTKLGNPLFKLGVLAVIKWKMRNGKSLLSQRLSAHCVYPLDLIDLTPMHVGIDFNSSRFTVAIRLAATQQVSTTSR
jgi:hypothetical protein